MQLRQKTMIRQNRNKPDFVLNESASKGVHWMQCQIPIRIRFIFRVHLLTETGERGEARNITWFWSFLRSEIAFPSEINTWEIYDSYSTLENSWPRNWKRLCFRFLFSYVLVIFFSVLPLSTILGCGRALEFGGRGFQCIFLTFSIESIKV